MSDVNQPAEPAAAEGCELFAPLRLTGGRRPSPLARQVAAGLDGDSERAYEFVVWLLQDVNAHRRRGPGGPAAVGAPAGPAGTGPGDRRRTARRTGTSAVKLQRSRMPAKPQIGRRGTSHAR